jgi:hypothetical protein
MSTPDIPGRRLRRWRRKVAAIVLIIGSVVAATAVFLGNVATIRDAGKQIFWPAEEAGDIRLRDIRTLEGPLVTMTGGKQYFVVIEYVADKSGTQKEECEVELLMRDQITWADTANDEKIQIAAGRVQLRLTSIFQLLDEELDRLAKLRLSCKGVFSPWVEFPVPPKKQQ